MFANADSPARDAALVLRGSQHRFYIWYCIQAIDLQDQLFHQRDIYLLLWTQEELQRSSRTGEPLSLVIVDVDHFKHYNDTYGHPAGDVALRKLAIVLKQVARITDTVIRLCGDEFLLLLSHTDEASCYTVAKSLSRLVSELDNLEAVITVSTGGATLMPAMGTTHIPEADALLKQADDALYRAKQE